jgi:hypothetical protein
MVAVGDAPSCLVALGDIGDRAVHVFQSNGNYAFSFFGGARVRPEFGASMLSSLASGRADEFVVSTVGGRVVAFGGAGQRAWAGQLQPARAANDSGAGNQVVLGPDGLLYDAWFSGNGPLVRREQWANDRALVRVFDRTGRMIRRIGKVSEYPGEGLTYFLNRGYVQIFADTLWFARKADARILAFPLKGPYDAPARILELPVYYRADAPIEDVSSDGSRVAVRIQEHLRGFTVAPSGEFYVVQNLSWPDMASRSTPWVPRNVITVVRRDGTVDRRVGVDGRILALAATPYGFVGSVVIGGRLAALGFTVNGLKPGANEVSCGRAVEQKGAAASAASEINFAGSR